MNDSRDLCAKEMLFFSKEEGISEYRSLEITSQQHLNLSSSKNVFRRKVWESGPLLKQVVSNPIYILVNTGSTGLLISWLFSFFFSSI